MRGRARPQPNSPEDVGFSKPRKEAAPVSITHGRFKVLPYDPSQSGGFIVYDPALPFANRRAAGPFPDRAKAAKECERLSIEATARGEKNEPEEAH